MRKVLCICLAMLTIALVLFSGSVLAETTVECVGVPYSKSYIIPAEEQWTIKFMLPDTYQDDPAAYFVVHIVTRCMGRPKGPGSPPQGINSFNQDFRVTLNNPAEHCVFKCPRDSNLVYRIMEFHSSLPLGPGSDGVGGCFKLEIQR